MPPPATLVISVADLKPVKAFILTVIELHIRMLDHCEDIPENDGVHLRMSTTELGNALELLGLETRAGDSAKAAKATESHEATEVPEAPEAPPSADTNAHA